MQVKCARAVVNESKRGEGVALARAFTRSTEPKRGCTGGYVGLHSVGAFLLHRPEIIRECHGVWV